MGRTPGDWDIATSARPEHVKALFARTVDTGLKHGTVTVLMEGTPYEVTTYRTEGAYADSRHPDHVEFVDDIESDLSRRDFTVNAMAYHPRRGLLDPFGGQADLKDRCIRCVGDPATRFGEDALRMMRAVRFACVLGFAVEPGTQAAICACAPRIADISAERVRDELNKLLLSAKPSRGLRLLLDAGLLEWVLPEVYACVGVEQNIKYHRYDVFGHTCAVVDNVPPKLCVRYAALLHDTGKPRARATDADGVDHFRGHAVFSEELARTAMDRLRLDNHTKERVVRLVRHHDRVIEDNKKAVRRTLSKCGEDLFLDLLALKRGDCLGQNPEHTWHRLAVYDHIEQLYHEVLEAGEAFGVRDLAVNGNDLLAEGLRGRQIGDMLGALLQHVLDCPEDNTREILLDRVRAARDGA